MPSKTIQREGAAATASLRSNVTAYVQLVASQTGSAGAGNGCSGAEAHKA